MILLFTLPFYSALSHFSLFLFSQTQEKPLRYEVEVVLVEIPTYVVDKKGNPVIDLKPDEITLTENGKKQKISHFVLVQNDSPQIASVVREYPAARRQFLLLFDFSFSTAGKIAKARRASLDFIQEKLLPNDLVAVVTYSAIRGLKVHSHFTNDREHLISIINSLGFFKMQRMFGPIGFTFPDFAQKSQDPMLRSGGGDEIGDAEFEAIFMQAKETIRKIYGSHVAGLIGDINKLSIALNTIKGRKHVIFFSEGFESEVITRDTGLRMKLYDALKLIASADCPIHTIDIGGLRTQAGEVGKFEGGSRSLASIRSGQDTLSFLSRETGGQVYRNINELDRPLENLLKITNTYYIIGYYPEDNRKEGKYRKIKLKVDRPNVRVSYRKGYYEAKPYAEYSNLEKRLQLVEYVVNDSKSNEIPFQSSVSAFRGKQGICQVPVFIKFPGRQFLERKNRRKLEIYGYAISGNGVFKDFFHQTVRVSPDKIEEQLELGGIKYYDLHLVPPGDYRIRLIVRDAATGEVSAQTQKISVPDYESGELCLSGPVFIQPDSNWVLIRGYDPKLPTGRKVGVNLPLDYPYVYDNKPFIPGVVPTLNRLMPARFCFRVNNLRIHPQAKIPQTEIRFDVVDAEGKSNLLKRGGLVTEPKQPEPGVYDFLFHVNLSDLSPGIYQLKLTFKDILTNQEVISETLFTLE